MNLVLNENFFFFFVADEEFFYALTFKACLRKFMDVLNGDFCMDEIYWFRLA